MKKFLHCVFFWIIMFLPCLGQAKISVPDPWKKAFSEVWHSSDIDLYVPLRTWHNRNHYTSEKIRTYNEEPWGIGIGKRYVDEKGNLKRLTALAFKDSHNDWEPFFAYAWEAKRSLFSSVKVGGGFLAGFTMRSDYDYVPIPALLPIVSIQWQRVSLEATYVPGGKNNGNVLFVWSRFEF